MPPRSILVVAQRCLGLPSDKGNYMSHSKFTYFHLRVFAPGPRAWWGSTARRLAARTPATKLDVAQPRNAVVFPLPGRVIIVLLIIKVCTLLEIQKNI